MDSPLLKSHNEYITVLEKYLKECKAVGMDTRLGLEETMLRKKYHTLQPDDKHFPFPCGKDLAYEGKPEYLN